MKAVSDATWPQKTLTVICLMVVDMKYFFAYINCYWKVLDKVLFMPHGCASEADLCRKVFKCLNQASIQNTTSYKKNVPFPIISIGWVVFYSMGVILWDE